MPREFLTVKEAAAFIKRSRGNLYNMVCQKKIRYYKPSGKMLLFDKADLIDWIMRGAVASDEEIAELASKRS
jgi:excisionase family DNA binding protein